jgi:obg-like ATPase 1
MHFVLTIVFFCHNSKSSLFNALTNSSVPAENYPFCTIDPSEARVQVPDDRFDWLVDTYKPDKITPAHVI